ncbi:MAG: hypothetical protein ACAI25_00260, partial [Planctomycetota bacterium]
MSSTQSKQIGSRGGTFLYDGDPLAGAAFNFPAGAVNQPITFTITPTGAPTGAWTVVGPGVALGPANMTFGKLVTVTLPFDPLLVPTGQQSRLTVYVQDGSGTIRSLGSVLVTGNTVVVPADVTGLFFAALLPGPDATTSTVTASPATNILANGAASSTITVTARDAAGNAL